MLDRLTERAGLRQGVTVVVDRGMAFDDNLAEITHRNDGEKTYALCRSEQRIAKDGAIRTMQEGRPIATISQATSSGASTSC